MKILTVAFMLLCNKYLTFSTKPEALCRRLHNPSGRHKGTSSLVIPAINSLKEEHMNNVPTRYNFMFLEALKTIHADQTWQIQRRPSLPLCLLPRSTLQAGGFYIWGSSQLSEVRNHWTFKEDQHHWTDSRHSRWKPGFTKENKSAFRIHETAIADNLHPVIWDNCHFWGANVPEM